MTSFVVSATKIVLTLFIAAIVGTIFFEITLFDETRMMDNPFVAFTFYVLFGVAAYVIVDRLFASIMARLPKWLFTAIIVIFWICVLLVLGYFVIALSVAVNTSDPVDARIKADLSGARAQAELYWDSHGNSYARVCDPLNNNIETNSEIARGINAIIASATKAQNRNSIVDINQAPFVHADALHGKCNDSEKAYAAEVILKSTGFWCIDSTGVAQKNESPGLTATDDYSCEP